MYKIVEEWKIRFVLYITTTILIIKSYEKIIFLDIASV